MFKFAAFSFAALLSASVVMPSIAMAIDNGPCDHCTMEPIVVKGDRSEKEKDTAETADQNSPLGQPAAATRLQIPTLGTPTVPAEEPRR